MPIVIKKGEMLRRNRPKFDNKLYFNFLAILFVILLLWAILFINNEISKKSAESILTKTQNNISEMLSDGEILRQTYRLNFDEEPENKLLTYYESKNQDLKTKSGNLETVRKTDRNFFAFIGHDIKNQTYDRFYVEKNRFFDSQRKADVTVLINSFVSRGLSMYTVYSPRQFWSQLIDIMLNSSNLRLRTEPGFFVISGDTDKNSTLNIRIDMKTNLPSTLKIVTNSKKLWHEEATFDRLEMSIIKEEILKTSENSIIFDLAIPEQLNKRILNLKPHEENEDTGAGLGEEVCTSCHYKSFKIERFEL